MRFSRITVISGISAVGLIGAIAIPASAQAGTANPTAIAKQALSWTSQLNADMYNNPTISGLGLGVGGNVPQAVKAVNSKASTAESDAKAAQATANAGIGDVIHWSTSTSVPAGAYGQVTASCADATGLPAGTNIKDLVAMGGGYELDNGSGDAPGADKFAVTLDRNTPGPGQNDGWIVGGTNNDTSAHTLYAWVTCINAPNDNSGS